MPCTSPRSQSVARPAQSDIPFVPVWRQSQIELSRISEEALPYYMGGGDSVGPATFRRW